MREAKRVKAELARDDLSPADRGALVIRLRLIARIQPSQANVEYRAEVLRARLADRKRDAIRAKQSEHRPDCSSPETRHRRDSAPRPERRRGSRRQTGSGSRAGPDDGESEPAGGGPQLELGVAEPGQRLYRREEISEYIAGKSAAFARGIR